MSEKKPIDRLFQERFKDFEATPSDAVWDKIKTQRQQKDRKFLMIPLWYRIAGAAAVIAIAVTLGYQAFNHESTATPELVTAEPTINKEQDIKSPVPQTVPQKETPFQNEITTTEEPTKNNSTHNAIPTESHAKEEKRGAHYKNSSEKGRNPIPPNQEAFAHIDTPSYDDDPIAQTKKQSDIATLQTTTQPSKIATDTTNQELPIETTNKGSETNDVITAISTIDSTKKSIYDTIKEDEENIVVNDEKSTKKWNVMPSVAPVFYNSLGKGSSIAAAYVDNTKTAEANLSYGVQIAYEVTDRIHIRGGVHKLNLSYATQDVGLSRSVAFNNTNSFSSELGDLALVDLSSDQIDAQSSPINAMPVDILNNPEAINASLEGKARQRIGYIEVPVEMTYALINKRFGLHMIGGLSTLFLNENDNSLTFVSNDGTDTELGKVENLNTFSFSGNLGIGMDYKISQRFKLHVEPIFKYQINAYSNETDFNPYIFGVYTGLSFKF